MQFYPCIFCCELPFYFGIFIISVILPSFHFCFNRVDFDWTIKRNKGDTLVFKQGSWTYVLRKVNDEWKFVIEPALICEKLMLICFFTVKSLRR
jgi:hypothetical protein